MFLSCGCKNDVCSSEELFKNFPCEHDVCPGCMVKNLLTKPRFGIVSCPGCKKPTTHHVHKGKLEQHTDPEISKDKDPFRHFMYNIPDQKRKGKMIVALLWQSSSEQTETKKRFVALLDENKGAVEANDEKNLVCILSALRVVVFAGTKDQPNSPTMNSFQWKRSVFDDIRPITKYFFAFCMGGTDLEKEKSTARNDKEVKSKILANGVLIDVALRIVDHYGGMQPFQQVLGQFVSTLPKSTGLQKFLSSVRLSSHRTTEHKKASIETIEMIQKGQKLDERGFAAGLCDNVDYTGKAKKDCWTHFLISNNSEEDMRSDGAYEWERYDGTRWEDLEVEEGQDQLVARVFDISDDDWLTFSNYELSIINTIKNVTLPTSVDCKDMEQRNSYQNVGKVPLNLGNPLAEPTNPRREREHDTGKQQDFYARNRLLIQPPLHSNLGKKDTVLELTRAAIATFDRWIPQEDGEHTLQGLIYAICADGGPVELFMREKEEMEQRGDYSFDKVEWFSMSFHLMINSLRNLNGKHSKEAFVSVCKRWRNTTQRLDWALACPDPKDIFNELFQYKIAMIRNVCDNVGTDENPRVIHDYLIQRSMEYPICMLYLIHLKFTTLILMLRDSSRSGDHGNIPLYLTCLRYLIRLEAISNAPKYLHMNTHFLRWHECASTCLKKIFEHYLFTKVTKNGELMPGDLCMEKHIGDVRYMYGKKMFKGMVARFMTEVPNINKIMSRYHGDEFGDERKDEYVSYNTREYILGEVYIKAYNFAESLNMWGVGPPNLEDNENLISLSTKEPINASILSSWSVAEERVRDYCMGKEKVKLSCFRSRAGQVQADTKDELIKTTSTSVEELLGLKTKFTKAEIYRELQAIRMFLGDADLDLLDLDRLTEKSSKIDLLDALATSRETYFDDYPEAYDERVESCEVDELHSTFTSFENRETEINTGDKFYKLHPEALVANNDFE